ncbi:DUF1592 domain-containing protein [Microvenator marinus]|uniref:DUF1592 domain-containing protein n=1 Tax=Microvenator marinus TaxID=2600177 RepID=A0A5B8XQZ8_9DELT|nr:DUF1592 domain-containing protein [Microvenator marinus]QED26463.1 DUF1592 domain-containing protein [Microvenator marinus]
MRKITFLALFAGLAFVGCSSEDSPSEPEVRAELEAQPAKLPRLTQTQYNQILRDFFGPDLVLPVRLEPDARTSGLVAAGASATSISTRGAELYETAAYEVSRQVMQTPEIRDRVMPCEPSGVEDLACAEEFIKTFGERAWRRPLDSEEIERLLGISQEAISVTGAFYDGLEFALAAILQSPNFLFRAELGEDARDLNAYELASRLSFFLWNTTPDNELLELARSGELLDDAVLEETVDRMLEDPRARRGVRQFFVDHYELDRLDGLTKAPELFPHISEEVGESAREETLSVLEEIIFDGSGDFRDALTTRKTFINRKLAAIYDVPAPAREGFAEYEFSQESLRRGILGHVSFLAVWSHPVSTSATLRGMFVQQKLLCRVVPPPPAGVDTSIPEPTGNEPTLRDRIAVHLEDPNCASCHNLTDKIGLAYENFDGIGRYRPTDNGAPLELAGDLDGDAFEDPTDLAELVREHKRLGECLTQKMAAYATNSGDYAGEDEDLRRLAESFAAANYDVKSLMKALVLSDAFRKVKVSE